MATTISISNDLKAKLRNIGKTGDSYEDVIRRMYEHTRKNILLTYLYDDSDSMSIDEAINQAKKEKMAKVTISESLKEEIFRTFKQDSREIFDLMKTLESNPYKGKSLGHVAEVVIKEIKYGKYRFYFITDGHILKFGTVDEIASLLIKFVRMSEKRDRHKIINEIKNILKSFGFDGM